MFFGILCVLFLLIGLLCVYGKVKHSHFEKTAVKYVKPPLPIAGNHLKLFLGLETGINMIENIYNAFPDQKYIGMFDNFNPVILLRDLDLIKQIGIKNFETFHDHNIFVSEDIDLFGKSLIALRGNKWKDMRSTLSPAFSSSKMRNMFSFMEKCSKRMCALYLKEFESQEIVDIEMKDAFSKYTLEVILTTAYGLEVDSLTEENIFYKVCKDIMKFSKLQILKMFTIMYAPKMAKLLGIKFINDETAKFFKDVVINTMKDREKNKVHRPDMIQLLMEAKKGTLVDDDAVKDVSDEGFASAEQFSFDKKRSKQTWDDDYITAQAFIFFAAGFDTTSTALSWFFYEIARHPDIQMKLQKEIDELRTKRGEVLNYYDLLNMKYLDMCVSESLRMWPFLSATDRQCSKEYDLPPPCKNTLESYTLRENQLVYIPIYALHFDPTYFPNPKKFDPERFSDENKSNIKTGSYLPFGIGPRNCIGSRYALLVLKSVIFNILSNFDVTVTQKTDIPMKLDSNPFHIKPGKSGVWLGLKKRNKSA